MATARLQVGSLCLAGHKLATEEDIYTWPSGRQRCRECKREEDREGRKPPLVGQDVIASELGVKSQTVSMWFKREREDIDAGKPAWGMPESMFVEFTLGKRPWRVWKRTQIPAWRKWHAQYHERTGQFVPLRNRKVAA